MFVESPRCKEGLQINLKSDLQSGGREEVDLYGQRWDKVSMLIIFIQLSKKNKIFPWIGQK